MHIMEAKHLLESWEYKSSMYERVLSTFYKQIGWLIGSYRLVRLTIKAVNGCISNSIIHNKHKNI